MKPQIRDNLEVVKKCDKHVGYEVFIKEGYYVKDECPVCTLMADNDELTESLKQALHD